MGILAGDIKLVKSVVMDDVPEGGGPPSAEVVVDGLSNSLFNDISELDRAGGRVNLRKAFLSVRTDDREGYFGANVIVAKPLQDPRVSVTIFSTGNVFDTREQASSRVEAYLNAGPEWPAFLYENHIAGQRVIQLFARTKIEPPAIGRTLVLRMNEGTGTQFEQYVRVTRTEAVERTFTEGVPPTDFQAQVITCDISDALRVDFPGSPATRYFTRLAGKTLLRDTVVADAGSYFGVVPLAQAAEIGDPSVAAESVYTQLVPNSRTETAVIDQLPSQDATITLASTPILVEFTAAPYSQRIRIGQENRGFNYVSILKPLPAPGSVRVVYRALGSNYVLTDDGLGNLVGLGAGTINYLTGSISITVQELPDDRSGLMIYWGEKVAYTNRTGEGGFRPPEFGLLLEKQDVEPGSLTLTWTSGSLVKTATDSNGTLIGDATGEVYYAQGEVYFKPVTGAFPDAGAEFAIDYEWATVEVETKTGLSPDGSGVVNFTLDLEPVPGSIRAEWITTRTTTESSGTTLGGSSSNKGSMSGSGAEQIKTAVTRGYAPGSGLPLETPGYTGTSFGTDPTGRYTVVTDTFNTDVKRSVTTTGSNGSSYTREVSSASSKSITTRHTATDDGVTPVGGFPSSLGLINYSGKTVAIKVQANYSEQSYKSNHEDAQEFESFNSTSESATGYAAKPAVDSSAGGGGASSSKGGEYSSVAVRDTFSAAALVVSYKVAPVSPTAHAETFTPPAVVIDICPYTSDTIIPGSLQFMWMGTSYRDFEGVVYRGRTGSDPGIASGTVDYVRGLVAMWDYVVAGDPAAFSITSLWTTKRAANVATVVFTAKIAPIKPGGLVVSVVDSTGEQLIVTANIGGDVDGPHAHGKIDYETGQCEINFGDYVLDSGLTAAEKLEWWYDADDVRVDGKIWRPWPVNPNTVRYNLVAYAYLPLDAGILGMDPVRLPQDGRVPIFRRGGFAVVGHTGTVGPATVSNGQVINCARVRLSRVRVIGNDGLVIDTGYTTDLDAGLVTFDDVSGYSQPVTVEHRVEDMAMISDVQINGTVAFTRQLTHDYPVPGSYLSSALVAGDLRSRVSLTFDQVTWNNVWADVQSGSAAVGTFNAAAYPIEVANRGALTERWAVVFSSTTNFSVIGEHVGVIAVGSISADCSPLNPASGTPYLTIPALGWGLGWATGNVLRINTVGLFYPVWIVRTIQQGPESVVDDAFTLLLRGDVDRP